MRRIAVVGGGQSGMQLAFGLLREGYDVTVYTDRGADEVARGPVMSAQCMFESSLQLERAMGLDVWAGQAPRITGMSMTRVDPSGTPIASWVAALDNPARSVDQRLKISTWMRLFEAEGGTLVVTRVSDRELDDLASEVDLVVVATGLSRLGDLFPVNEMRTTFTAPQRALALTYFTGHRAADSSVNRFHHIQGVGEYYSLPALTESGPCEIMMIEGIPGGPLDCWSDVASGEDHLDRCRDFLEKYLPEEAARCHDIRLTDDGGRLSGEFRPVVRHPVGRLPSGRPILGMADAVVLNDPVTAQGANNAAKSADMYLHSILARGERPFDEPWMRETFEFYWRNYGQWATRWTNSMLNLDGSPGARLIDEAAGSATLARHIVNGYDDPRTLYPAWFDANECEQLVQRARRQDADLRFDARALRRALGQFATGVVVVTTRSLAGERLGLTVNSFTSLSMNPPLVLWCLATSSRSLQAFRQASHFTIHVLAADQHHLSRQFSNPQGDKFAGIPDPDASSVPSLPGVAAQFSCRNIRQYVEGDHVIFIGEIEGFDQFDKEPLVFHSGAYRIATRHPEVSA